MSLPGLSQPVRVASVRAEASVRRDTPYPGDKAHPRGLAWRGAVGGRSYRGARRGFNSKAATATTDRPAERGSAFKPAAAHQCENKYEGSPCRRGARHPTCCSRSWHRYRLRINAAARSVFHDRRGFHKCSKRLRTSKPLRMCDRYKLTSRYFQTVNNVWSCGRTRSRVVGGQRRVSPSRVAYWYAGGTPGRIVVLSWYTSTPDMPVPSIHRTPYDKQTVVRRDLLPASTHTHKNSTTL